MKKLVAVMGVSLTILGMTACGNRDNNADTSQNTTQTSEVMENTASIEQTTATEETAAAGETAGAEEIGTNGWSEEMTALRQTVVDAVGEDNYWPDSQIPPEMLEQTFGISRDMYDDYMGEMPMISVNVDTLLIIKAKDDKVEAVEKALNDYRDAQVNNTMQYPMNVGKIQASRIQRYGNYVCFVQLGADTGAAEEDGDEAVIKACQEQNELVLEVIGHNVPK